MYLTFRVLHKFDIPIAVLKQKKTVYILDKFKSFKK